MYVCTYVCMFVCMFLHRCTFWSPNSLLEGKLLVSWSHSYTLPSWGLGACPQKIFKNNLSRMMESVPSQDRRDVNVYVFKEILAPTAPTEEAEKTAAPLLPLHWRPSCYYSYFSDCYEFLPLNIVQYTLILLILYISGTLSSLNFHNNITMC